MSFSRRHTLFAAAVFLLVLAGIVYRFSRFPPDTTPEGAYLRVAASMSQGEPEACFPYLEEDAQHALFSIRNETKQASERIQQTYPYEAQAAALARYQPILAAGEVEAVWLWMAQERGWLQRLRRDLSGVAEVQVADERATVVTVRGTRYTFRKRPNGIWGLTWFTAELMQEAEHLARDWERIQQAAADYQRTERP